MAVTNKRKPLKTIKPLKHTLLRKRCDAKKLAFKTTSDLAPLSGMIGQERAFDALHFGTDIDHFGYNLFVLGPSGTGRHSAVKSYLEKKAAQESAPDDWVYVHNFDSAHHPIAMKLPAGKAIAFRAAMEELIDDLCRAIPDVFNSDEYHDRRKALNSEFEEKQENAFSELNEKANAQDVVILHTPMGFGLAPTSNGEVIKPDIYNQLPKDERAAIEDKIAALQTELTAILEQLPLLQKAHRDALRELNAEMTSAVVDTSIQAVGKQFEDIDVIEKRLAVVRYDLIDNAELFLSDDTPPEGDIFPKNLITQKNNPRYNRYRINVIIANDSDGDSKGSPLIFEDHPTLAKLIGRIEHLSQFGALVTDFTMIRPGALHRANGGYLVVDVRKILSEPFAWEALKRALRAKEIKIVSAVDEMGFTSTVSLEPEPIPLDVKVILIGERIFYYLLCDLDPEFGDLFKIEVDFDDQLQRTDDNVGLYARLIATIAQSHKLRPLSADAVATVVEQTARLAEDSERLSLRVGLITTLLQEANHWAGIDGKKTIAASNIQHALDEQLRRSSRVQELNKESIERGIRLIATDGSAVGQINALSVFTIGKFAFGQPSRITARVLSGAGKVIDIERETKLGGPLHSKGVLILSGYLAAQFAEDIPLSLWASLVFEQSYGGVDGDSASCAELCALLSALSHTPIKQGFAVTGSVNQLGAVQAIGSVNEKIEGFFDICAARGLTGDQGVLIPDSNVKHLMLKREVVDAAKAGSFGIYPMESVSDAISLLTGENAGERGKDGTFPKNTINGRIEATLRQFTALQTKQQQVEEEQTS